MIYCESITTYKILIIYKVVINFHMSLSFYCLLFTIRYLYIYLKNYVSRFIKKKSNQIDRLN